MIAIRPQIAIALLLVPCFAAGCQRHSGAAKTVVRVNPAKLSSKESKRLRSQNGVATAQITLEHGGEPIDVVMTVELRQKGKSVPPIQSSACRAPDDYTLSATRSTALDGKPQMEIRVNSLTFRHSINWVFGLLPVPTTFRSSPNQLMFYPIPSFPQDADPGTIKSLEGPAELTADHPLAIWAFVAGGRAEKKSADESIDTAAAHAEWAIVVTVSLPKKP